MSRVPWHSILSCFVLILSVFCLLSSCPSLLVILPEDSGDLHSHPVFSLTTQTGRPPFQVLSGPIHPPYSPNTMCDRVHRPCLVRLQSNRP